MKENTQEKALVELAENSIFYKIKNFFRKLFHQDIKSKRSNIFKENTCSNVDREKEKNAFIESIRNVENEETKLLKLQKQYRNGEIKEEDLTEEQVNSLCEVYDKQIASIKKSNESKRQKILIYRRLQEGN